MLALAPAERSSTATGTTSGASFDRRAAREAFSRMGVPGRKHEEWRHTPAVRGLPSRPLDAIGRGGPADSAHALPGFLTGLCDADWIVIRDGALARGPGPVGRDLASTGDTAIALVAEPEGPAEASAFAQLNLAGCSGEIRIRLDGKHRRPLALFLESSGALPLVCPRVAVRIEADAEVDWFEVERQPTEVFSNTVVRFSLGPRAKLRRWRVSGATQGSGLHQAGFELAQGARLETTSVIASTGWAREEIAIDLIGQGASVSTRGLYCSGGQGHAEARATVRHLAPACESRQLFKGAVAGAATGVFGGFVHVAPGARGSDARQVSRSVQLSPGAQVFANPRLEILNDEVACSHGATTSRLDEESLFYLRSRAIGPTEAARLLTEAFTAEVIDGLPAGTEGGLRALARGWSRRALDGVMGDWGDCS